MDQNGDIMIAAGQGKQVADAFAVTAAVADDDKDF